MHNHNHAHHHTDAEQSVNEVPLDPANQSLADALKSSFRVLKFIMALVAIIYLASGVTMVDQKEVVVLTFFGKQVGTYQPGLLWAWPYPIHEKIRVPTTQKTLFIDDFWLTLGDRDKGAKLSDLGARGGGLDPATNGAVLTGDRAIMHLKCMLQYHIEKADLYVENVKDEESLLRAIVQNATVAESARTTADVVWKDADKLAKAIWKRSQKILDRLQTGIVIEKVAAPQSYYPLQTKNEFLEVSTAENKKRELIQDAEAERAKILNGVAGEAWGKLQKEIEKLDQVGDGPDKKNVIENIENILVNEAAGEAGGLIKLAESERDTIIADTKAEVRNFESLLARYRQNPELLRKQLRRDMLTDLYTKLGVTKWWLPSGDKGVVLWLNRDPVEIRELERTRALEKVEEGK